MSKVLLELIDVQKTYGTGENEVHALRGASLQVKAGELVAIMGASGSGKSTLLTIAGGLEVPTREMFAFSIAACQHSNRLNSQRFDAKRSVTSFKTSI